MARAGARDGHDDRAGYLHSLGSRGVPKRMHNIGVRIEDDVVVTRTGVEVLTSQAPKSVEAIEALMCGGG